MKEKTLLFSVTAKDCEWSYTKGSGAGGQKRNKTSSAVHCKHLPSGAHGYAEDHREQRKNRELAFERMAKSKEFKNWHQMETARRSGTMATIEYEVEKQMRPKNLRIEGKDAKGTWQDIEKVKQND